MSIYNKELTEKVRAAREKALQEFVRGCANKINPIFPAGTIGPVDFNKVRK